MRKGQTSKRNGYQDFLCPFETLNITQKHGGSFTHKGTKAVDVAGAKAGTKDAYYAPCDCKVIKTYPSAGQALWQSTKKVRFANGKIEYATFMTVHDDTMNFGPGYSAKQGEQIGNMGTAGNATGVHCHIQIAQTKNTAWERKATYKWTNGALYPVYGFFSERQVDECWFIDGTEIINGAGYSFKKLKDVPTSELDVAKLNKKPKSFIAKGGTFKVTSKSLKIMHAPNVNYSKDTNLVYRKDESVVFDGYVNHDGYRWISWISKSTNTRRWMKAGKVNTNGAITTPYGNFK